MKICIRIFLGAMIAMAGVSIAPADVVIVGVDGSMSAGGATTVIEGDLFTPGGSATQIPERWTNPGAVGTDFVGIFGGTNLSNTDWYVKVGDTNGAGANALNLPGTVGYLEIFYSLDQATSGSNMRFAVNGNTPAEAFGDGVADLIPDAAGSHSFVIDVSQLSIASTPGAELDYIRWDPWNEELGNNRGTQFTVDKIVYGDQLVNTAVPEPGSLAMIGLGGVGMLLRRRK
jgi:hypothetical protein